MKQLLKNIIFIGAFVSLFAAPVVIVAIPQVAHAATSVADCEKSMLGMPPWYRGLTKLDGTDCVIISPADPSLGAADTALSTFIWRIVLNIIEMALVIVAWIAVFFILHGGFLFITGGGNSSQIEKARKSIFNAVIGLVIALGAIAITNLVFNSIEGIGATTLNDYGVPQIEAGSLLKSGLNLAYYIAGIVAVIVIIIAGITYVTSMGDSGAVSKAKNMILYSVIGIIVIVIAFVITNFVVGAF